jgi:hypothetical protein
MTYLDLRSAICRIDYLLRQQRDIREFTTAQDCIFRIGVVPAGRPVALSDGVTVHVDDPVLELHFWNEHLPRMANEGPSAGWGSQMKRRLTDSLAAVADHLRRDRELDAVVAIMGIPRFASRIGTSQAIRTAGRFGFDVFDSDAANMAGRVHGLLDSMLLWGLGCAFNPGTLRNGKFLQHRFEVWMSRSKLLRRYDSVVGPENSKAARLGS